uniref:NADH-ubiquinone oxidoreductase chain 5 n=1 Tax=Phymorhynchus sp. LD-2020 TaxID=2723149 RepID=A0A6H0ENE1_9CAEN|nr:NADH dehydrogenase subunit 5 [Phymorhynchus sp. LD-2020]
MNTKLKSSSISSIMLLMYSVLAFSLTLVLLMKNKSMLIEWTIMEISSCSLSMIFIFDYISLSFSAVVCLISGCVMMFSSSYMAHDPFLKRFTWLVMLFVLSMNLLVFIPVYCITISLSRISNVSFALVIYYQNMKSLGAGMVTMLANRIGDVMILISIGLFVLQGHWNIISMWNFDLAHWAIIALLIAAMTKSAQIPFSSWLPAAMAAPTPVSALVHSSTLVTAGVFLLIRFFPFFSTLEGFKEFLLFISVLTLLMAGIGANYEKDLKKIIALSTLSQLGVMMMSLALGAPHLALFHLYTHALFKALLFLCAGMIIHNSYNTQDIRFMGLMSKQLPLTIMCMNVANLSLCGAPFLSGFYSKDLILELSLFNPTSTFMLILIFAATAMTAAYSFRLSLYSLWSPMKNYPMHGKQESDPYVNWATTILTTMTMLAGFFFQSIFLNFNPMPFVLPNYLKFLTMTVLAIGLLLTYMAWNNQFGHSDDNMLKMKMFFSTMWFLSLISTQPLTKMSMNLGTNLMKSLDMGWLEIMGGQGAFKISSSLSLNNQLIQIKTFNFLVTLIIFSALLLSGFMALL